MLLASLAVVAAGAGWYFVKGNPWAATVSKATNMPGMPKSGVPSAAESAVVAPPPEMEVTIPAEDLDRLHLKFAKVTEAAVKVEVRVPGTVQPNA
jgi:hypothetical protein